MANRLVTELSADDRAHLERCARLHTAERDKGDDLVRRLERLEKKLDRVLVAVVNEEDLEACPHCGDREEIEDTSVMGEAQRLTCHACGKSWRPDDEA